MRMLHPRDNALFLVAWRERMRPATVLAAAVVTVAVTMLVLVGYFASPDVNDVGHAMEFLSILQGFVLFILGSYQVGRVAAREREKGTIDFHRASPTSRLDQVLGLVLGAPALEWCVFAATFVVSLVLLPMSPVSAAAFFGLYVSMVLTALFFHSLAAAVALARGEVQKTIKGNAMGVVPAIVLLIAGGVAIGLHTSTLYHATSIPAYARFFHEAVPPIREYWRRELDSLRPMLFSVFGVRLPSILLQIIVQVPFAVLAWMASIRVITNPERPVLSKRQLLAGAGHVLLLFIASATSYLTAKDLGWGSRPDPSLAAVSFILVAFIVGAAGAYVATPRQLLYLRGLRKARKLGRGGLAPMEDAASNWAWLAIYCLLAAAAYGAMIRFFDTEFAFALGAGLVVMLSWCAWFGGALEYFRLGPYRKSGSLFAVAIFLLWFFVPMFGVVLDWAGAGENVDMFYTTSPFIGLRALTVAVAEGKNTDFLGVALAVNLALVVATAVLAARARHGLMARCAAEAVKDGTPDKSKAPAAEVPDGGN